jgi:uncharacterized membrane protein YidH (DUF202 family)
VTRTSLWLLVAGVALAAFGWWGVETTGGRRRFDEMAGMIPMGAGAIGVLLVLVALVLRWRAR